jgi:hypothetical protein
MSFDQTDALTMPGAATQPAFFGRGVVQLGQAALINDGGNALTLAASDPQDPMSDTPLMVVDPGFADSPDGYAFEFWAKLGADNSMLQVLGVAPNGVDWTGAVIRGNAILGFGHHPTGDFLAQAPFGAVTGQTYQVAVTYDARPGRPESGLHLYVNGVETASGPDNGQAGMTGAGEWTLSLYRGTVTIDALSLYDHSLTAERAAAHYNAGRITP